MAKLSVRALDKKGLTHYIDSTPRIVRFLGVGGLASLAQLALLHFIQLSGISVLLANFFAFEIATQLNFILSYLITWRDRRPPLVTPRYILERTLAFNTMAISTLVVNMAVFALVLLFAHYLIAGAAGIAVATIVNFIVSGHIIFRPAPFVESTPSANWGS